MTERVTATNTYQILTKMILDGLTDQGEIGRVGVQNSLKLHIGDETPAEELTDTLKFVCQTNPVAFWELPTELRNDEAREWMIGRIYEQLGTMGLEDQAKEIIGEDVVNLPRSLSDDERRAYRK